jgi:DNA adenine methylase
MIKSPLRYPGGKSRAVGIMSKLVPEFDEYREPLVGGGSFFVYLKQKYSDKSFWINDLYEPLYHFWNEAKNNMSVLIRCIDKLKDKFDDGKKLHLYLQENMNEFNPIEKAAAFFVFNRITFSGTSESGGYSEASYKGRFTESSIDRVESLSKILNDTKITNFDYQDIIENPGKNVFLYLDPPYYSATKSALYGKNGNLHKSFDHFRFAEVMQSCKHRWLITYDDNDFIRGLFSFANILKWDNKYGMRNVTNNSNQIGKELFISNYLTNYHITQTENLFEEEYLLRDSINVELYYVK